MTPFKTLFIALFAFISVPIFAQIAKGNYNFSGAADLSANFGKREFYKSFWVNAAFSPSVSKFIKNKWLIGLQPNLSALRGRGKSSKSTATSSFSQGGGLGLRAISRYYFGNIKNTHFFGFAGLDIAQGYSNFKNSVFDSKFSSNQFGYSIGFGANIFLNSEVALEPTVSYSDYQAGYNQTNNGIPSGEKFNYTLFSIGVQLNNSLNFSGKADAKEPAQYIGKNRRTLGGEAAVKHHSNRPTQFSFSPQFSQFITSRIMLTGAMGISIHSNLSSIFNLGFRPLIFLSSNVGVRYYLPLGKRFFMYPELSAGLRSAGYPRDFLSNTFDTSLSIGSSYFLSENVALDMSFVQARFNFHNPPNRNTSGLLGIGNIGLLYFIR
jgi:opacity protein-like surface antigen